MKHVQILDSVWFKTDHRAVHAVLSLKPKMRYTKRNGANFRGWAPDLLTQSGCRDAFAYGTRAQIASVEKEENRTAPRANRVEFAFSSNLQKKASLETRDASGKDQGECRVGESPQENAKQAFQLELDCKTRKPRICSHKILPRLLLDSGRSGGDNPIRETSLGRVVEKLENGLCKRNADFYKETEKKS